MAGTPYWMAPEIIEMSGASAASDVWSVACTVGSDTPSTVSLLGSLAVGAHFMSYFASS